MRVLLAAAALAVATPVLADETTGTVVSIEPATKTLVMQDRTIWNLPDDVVLPEGLKAGERVRISYRSDADNGWKTFQRIERIRG